MKKFHAAFIYLILFSVNTFSQNSADQLPKVWMTYYDGKELDEDFSDMKSHGVDAVEVGVWGVEGNSRAVEVLEVARKTNMKLIIGIPEISEEAFNFPQDKVERAVMMGGAYNGKAIDRFRFPFTPQKHEITIESPVYDSTNCYGNIGRYFMGLAPVRAEVVIKKADFDGKQHLQIVPAKITPEKEHFWKMQFDLTGVEGDLDNVVLAVYWTSEGTRDYWIFGDAVSMYSEGFRDRLQNKVKEIITAWEDANNGVFPTEIIAVRYGDECFHISGHLNSDDCSFPMWDYSESGIQQFKETYNGEYPRGVGWPDMFGHEAYAHWMFNFHEAAAQSVKTVKTALVDENVAHLPIFRNMTRMNVFDVMNDWDGTGLDLLSKEFDILHLDPYPVNDNGYDEKLIPRDMTYIEGLSRRHNKKVVPWMQAHVYGQLNHPSPAHITKMMDQQKQFDPDAIIWLGYGGVSSGNTFPEHNKKSWEQAKIEHIQFKNQSAKSKADADFALVRPYTVRSLRSKNVNSSDRFLTDRIIENAVFGDSLNYDPFEPLMCGDISAERLQAYKFVIAELGILNSNNLKPFFKTRNPVFLFISNAEYKRNSLKECGIEKVGNGNQKSGFINGNLTLAKDVIIHLEANSQPVVWQKGNVFFVNALCRDIIDGGKENINNNDLLILKNFLH